MPTLDGFRLPRLSVIIEYKFDKMCRNLYVLQFTLAEFEIGNLCLTMIITQLKHSNHLKASLTTFFFAVFMCVNIQKIHCIILKVAKFQFQH